MTGHNPLAELADVSKHYQNNSAVNQILDKLSFSVHSGDAIAIVGPSGSGKSTILNIIGLLDTPNSGIVRFQGKETQTCSSDELAEIRNRHIGFVFQLHHLLPQLTLIENIMVPLIPVKDKNLHKQALKRGVELLDFVGLADKSKQRPGQLSVGECQRAAVVRALINEPELILADEPTGSLDFDSAARMADLFSGLSKNFNVGLVVVTHSTELAGRMKTVYRMQNGKLIKEG
jgi:ABC-type lipoprotein export system ATPase subunit